MLTVDIFLKGLQREFGTYKKQTFRAGDRANSCEASSIIMRAYGMLLEAVSGLGAVL